MRTLAFLLIPAALMLLAPVPRTTLAQVTTQVIEWQAAAVEYARPCETKINASSLHQTVTLGGIRYRCITGTWASHCDTGRYFIRPGTRIRHIVGAQYVPANVDDFAEYADVGYFTIDGGQLDPIAHQAATLTIHAANWQTACQSCTLGREPKTWISYGGWDKRCVYMTGENYGPDGIAGQPWCSFWDEWLEYQNLLATCQVGDFMGFTGGYNANRYLVVLEHSDDWTSGTLVSGFPRWDPAFLMADFNHDGAVGQQDIFDFLGQWCGGSMRADLDHSAAVDSGDLMMFLGAWFDAR